MKEHIEKKLKEQYGGIKIDEDRYLIPSNIISVDDDLEKDIDLSLKNQLENIEIEVKSGDYLAITCKKILPNNKKILEIVNMSNSQENVAALEFKGNLDDDERYEFIRQIALFYKLYKNKKVNITFYVCYNYEMVRALFE